MSKVHAYIRTSTNKQDYANQRYGILEFADRKGLKIDHWEEETISGTKKVTERNLGQLISNMNKSDILIITELSRIGRSLYDIMATLNNLIEKGVKVYSIKENYELGDNLNSKVLSFAFGLSAELERSLLSSRVKESLARRKASGKKLGRPKGFKLDKTKLTEHATEIRNLLNHGVSYRAIGRMFSCHHQTVSNFHKNQIDE